MKKNYIAPMQETVILSAANLMQGSTQVSMPDGMPDLEMGDGTDKADSRRRDVWEDDEEEDEY